MDPIFTYYLIVKGNYTRTDAMHLAFAKLDDPYPNEAGISIERVAWMTDWDYTRITLDNNTLPHTVVETRLNGWMIEHQEAPFPRGSLLWWRRLEDD